MLSSSQNLLLQGVSEPGATATLGTAAAPGRADRPKHCRDQLELGLDTLVDVVSRASRYRQDQFEIQPDLIIWAELEVIVTQNIVDTVGHILVRSVLSILVQANFFDPNLMYSFFGG